MSDSPLSPLERYSLIGTLVLLAGLSVLAGVSAQQHWVLWLAVSIGGLGGLTHELAQSGGKILFFQKQADGLYLGSVAGVGPGAAGGAPVARGRPSGGGPPRRPAPCALERVSPRVAAQ